MDSWIDILMGCAATALILRLFLLYTLLHDVKIMNTNDKEITRLKRYLDDLFKFVLPFFRARKIKELNIKKKIIFINALWLILNLVMVSILILVFTVQINLS